MLGISNTLKFEKHPYNLLNKQNQKNIRITKQLEPNTRAFPLVMKLHLAKRTQCSKSMGGFMPQLHLPAILGPAGCGLKFVEF